MLFNGEFSDPPYQVAFSDVRSGGAGVTHGLHSDRLYCNRYFHKLYLSGNPYAFINYFSSLCICKEIFFVVLGVGSI